LTQERKQSQGPREQRQKLRPIDLDDFLALEIPPREMLLDPVMPGKGLIMLYAFRGIGKTHMAMGMAFAVASGGQFLRWKAPAAKRVLYVDGEMPAGELKMRLEQIIAGSQTRAAAGMFQLLAADIVDGGLGNLAHPQIQARIDECLDGVGLLVLDNLSSLTVAVRDNDADSWQPIQEWLLRLRRRGVSVLLVHHAGKGGDQRGTSRREDILDTSIALKRPRDYVAAEGARFEVHIEKGRDIHGTGATPFEARLDVRYGAATWTMREIEDVEMARVMELAEGGMSEREIAQATGIPKSTVNRLKQRAKQQPDAKQPSFEMKS
jgi:putative DNA primase/helicase